MSCERKCEGCPAAGTLYQTADMFEAQARTIGEQSMSDVVDNDIAPALFKRMGHIVDELEEQGVTDQEVFESPEEFAGALRMQAAKTLERMDAQREEFEARAQKLTANCAGSLVLSETREGQDITVTVCMSPQLSDELGLVDCHISRKFADS